MENIFVESDRSYYQGFILNEQEFRRLIDTIIDQLKKAVSNEGPKLSFELKFQNGAIAKTTELEDIFAQENSGSSEIIRIRINSEIGDDDDNHKIEIIFRNRSSDNESGTKPINHIIRGKTKDWVFITSSLIEERIYKMKRKNILTPFSSKTSSKEPTSFPIALIMMVIIMFTALYMRDNSYLTDIESGWQNKEITDPIEVLIEFEKHRQMDSELGPIKWLLGGMFILLLGIFLLKYLARKFYPMYNFCWGDYLETFKKKDRIRKLFFTIVVLGILVSVAGGLIVKYM